MEAIPRHHRPGVDPSAHPCPEISKPDDGCAHPVGADVYCDHRGNFWEAAGAGQCFCRRSGKCSRRSNAAADGQNALAGATKKAGKEAKGALASFDQLNVLERNTADASAANSGAVSGTGPSVSVPAMTGEIGADVKLSPNVQHVIDAFKGFIDGLKVAAQPAKDAIHALWIELQRLGGFVWSGLQDFYNDFLKPVGTWVLGEGIPRLVNALKDGLSKVDWEKINGALDRLWKALAPFAVNVGEGLLWLWENVFVPFGTWVMNDAVPAFLDILSGAIGILDGVIQAVKPAVQWLWDHILEPQADLVRNLVAAALEGIADALTRISDWISSHQGLVQGMTVTVAAFFAAWKVVELLSFIQQSGGVVAALKSITTAIAGGTLAKLKDKAETAALNVMYAKDFVVSIAKSTAALAKQAVQWTIETAKKIASTAATWAHQAATLAATAATWLFNTAMTVLTSPITLVVAAIGALIAIVVLLVKNWDTVKAKAIECWDKIKDAWDKVGNWFYEHVTEPIANFFTGMWEGIKKNVSYGC